MYNTLQRIGEPSQKKRAITVARDKKKKKKKKHVAHCQVVSIEVVLFKLKPAERENLALHARMQNIAVFRPTWGRRAA